MPEKNLDKIAFWDNLKSWIASTTVLFAFTACYIIFDLNVPFAREELSGKVLSSIASVNYKTETISSIFVELKNGRTVLVPLPSRVVIPHNGDQVMIVRFIRQFFGDSFTLK